MRPRQPMRIFKSTLIEPPRYYASASYRIHTERDGRQLVMITGTKWDVTADIESIIAERSFPTFPQDKSGL